MSCQADDLEQARRQLGLYTGGETIEWITPPRTAFLARFPLLLNSSQDAKRVIGRAVELLRAELQAEAGTVFLLGLKSREVTFWAVGGGAGPELQGRRMPLGKGIVSWVIERGEPALVLNVSSDPRFFKAVDNENHFVTRDLICVPLAGRSGRIIGALQIINRKPGAEFSDADLRFLEICAPQVALAVENAMLYQQLEEGKRKLEQLERKKGEAMTVIAHEFRTPLNLIQNSCEILAGSSNIDATVRQTLAGTLTRGVERLSKLVSGVRDLAALTQKVIDLKQTAFPLGHLLVPALELFERAGASRRLKWCSDEPDPEMLVGGDPALLAVALNNLIANAVRFTPDGGTIGIRFRRALDLLTITVEDSGIGIAPQHHQAIFEKFYEVGSALHHASGEFEFKTAGLGIGLATAREIIRAHGSELEVASSEGKGSRFSFSLPVVG